MNEIGDEQVRCETNVLVRCFLELLHKHNYISNTCFFNSLNLLEEEEKENVPKQQVFR